MLTLHKLPVYSVQRKTWDKYKYCELLKNRDFQFPLLIVLVIESTSNGWNQGKSLVHVEIGSNMAPVLGYSTTASVTALGQPLGISLSGLKMLICKFRTLNLIFLNTLWSFKNPMMLCSCFFKLWGLHNLSGIILLFMDKMNYVTWRKCLILILQWAKHTFFIYLNIYIF